MTLCQKTEDLIGKTKISGRTHEQCVSIGLTKHSRDETKYQIPFQFVPVHEHMNHTEKKA